MKLRKKPFSISILLLILLLNTSLSIQSTQLKQYPSTTTTHPLQNYTHDVGCLSINHPFSTYATTLPVNTTIHNFGQTIETNFTTTTIIAEIQTNTSITLKQQNFSSPAFPPNGWISTHTNWMFSNTSYAGGAKGEAKLNSTPHIEATIRFYTTVNTSNISVMKIQFKHRLYYEYYYYYNCAVEISKDGLKWVPLWVYEPYETRENHTITLYTTYLNTTNCTYISWTFDGSEIYAWYLDNIEISSLTAQENPEYTNTIIIPSLQVNTSKYVDFTNWNPQFPPNQPNCQKPYLITSWTTLINPPDENPSNDQQTKPIILQYLHDVCIAEFLSPSNNHKIIPPAYKNLPSTSPPPITYIAPGTYPLQILVENQGTYTEDNLTCYLEIWEYDNYNATIVFNSSISNITLPPLGGEQILNFGNFTFENETIYTIVANIPLANDYYPKNNDDYLGIVVDNTPPVTEHYLHPEKPNGENGWYTKDVYLELIANDYDPYYYGSGVDYIQYRINKSTWITTYNGATITISQDSPELLIEYRAVDMVGNVEEPNNFTIKLDHTKPKPVDACWESDRQGLYWYIIFTIRGEDNISGMSHCEMYINNGLYETQTGPGPWYTFTLQWSSIFKKLKFNFKGYNQAGLYAEDYLDSITALISSHSNPLIFSKLFYSHPTNH